MRAELIKKKFDQKNFDRYRDILVERQIFMQFCEKVQNSMKICLSTKISRYPSKFFWSNFFYQFNTHQRLSFDHENNIFQKKKFSFLKKK